MILRLILEDEDGNKVERIVQDAEYKSADSIVEDMKDTLKESKKPL